LPGYVQALLAYIAKLLEDARDFQVSVLTLFIT